MARYIDADALKNNLISHGAICDFGQYLIDIQPAADVAPIRHGEWIVEKYDGIGIPVKCSSCCYGFRSSRSEWSGKYDYEDYEFCPNCGAKMDGKDDTNANM